MKVNVKATGIDDLVKELETLTDTTTGSLKCSVYKGAGAVADEMSKRVSSLKTSKRSDKKRKRDLYPYEKEALVDALGIAPIDGKSEVINTKVGFDGYVEHNGKRHPIPLIANACNAGTSFMKKQAFINATKRGSEAKAVAEMQSELENQIKRNTRGLLT